MHLGILGGGQLGRMLAQAAARLGVRCRVFDESPDACAGHLAELCVGQYNDLARLDHFAADLDAITYEFENVPVAAAEHLAKRVRCSPQPGALHVCQDRLLEKQLFQRLGVGTAAFATIDTQPDLDVALQSIGLPAVLKTRRLGYDGKGQAVIRSVAEARHAFTTLGSGRQALIYEAFVPFSRELSILALRRHQGQTAFYPLTENHHAHGILRVSRAPAPHLTPALTHQAQRTAAVCLQAMDYVGLLAIEFFEVEGQLLANEMAPRAHNSGHWTIDGSQTSQFENQIRAVLDWPLGPTNPIGFAGMLNLIGDHPPIESLLAIPHTHVHLYGKSPRPGRKIGHINLRTDSAAQLDLAIAQSSALIEPYAS